MELYYIVLSLPLCIVLFSHNMLYISVLLLNKLSFIRRTEEEPLIIRHEQCPSIVCRSQQRVPDRVKAHINMM